MKATPVSKLLFAAGVLLAFCTSAQAQLYVATGSTGVVAWFNFTIDPVLNRVTVVVDNTHDGVSGQHGIVTSFGFNIPSALAGTGSLFSTSGVPAGTWSLFEPYNLNNFDQDVGAGSGINVNGGQPFESVQPGSMATFVFQFADFADSTGFLGTHGVSLKWQSINIDGNPSDHAFGEPGGVVVLLTPVPEPSTYGLMGAATVMAMVAVRRRLQRRAVAV